MEGRKADSSRGADASSELCSLGSRCDGWSPRDPGSAPPRLRRRPPVSTGGRGPGSAPASPPPSCPPARRGKSARASGCPAPGAGDPRPPARAAPAAWQSPPARPLPRPEALAPGGSEDLRTGTWGWGAGGGAQGWPGTSAPTGPCAAPRVPAGGTWAGQPQSPRPGEVRMERRETREPGGFPKHWRPVGRPVFIPTRATGLGGDQHRKLLPRHRPQILQPSLKGPSLSLICSFIKLVLFHDFWRADSTFDRQA